MFSVLMTFLETSLIIIPLVLGAYLLISSNDHLTVRYQNIMLRLTRKPLKDEDFKNIKEKLFLAKLIGSILFLFGLLMFLFTLLLFELL